eukprot:Sspe_Gene.31687::Locus_15606_Transcript_1_1_Confidence_1.000_Length_6859::g.31687::m.31687/K10590/TRIP12; E3 ubiquitin-protein ligase TRIP12
MEEWDRLLEQLIAAKNASSEPAMVSICEEICTLLCIGTDEHIRGIDPNHLVKNLGEILKMQSTIAELKVFAMRAIALTLDIVPRTGSVVVSNDILPLIVSHLNNPDTSPQLAEELIKALESISSDSPFSIVKAGGLVELLTWIDGLDRSKERLHTKVVNVVANICSRLRASEWGDVQGVLPALTALLQNSLQRQQGTNKGRDEVDGVVGRVCVTLAHLVDRLGTNEALFEAIVNQGVLTTLLQTLDSFASVVPAFETDPESPAAAAAQAQADRSHDRRASPTQRSFILKVLAVIHSANPAQSIRLFIRQHIFQSLCGMIVFSSSTAASESVASVLNRSGGGADGDTDTGPSYFFKEEHSIAGMLDFLSIILPPLHHNPLLSAEVLVPFHEWRWEDDYHNFTEFDSMMCHKLEAEYMKHRQKQNLKSVTIAVSGRNYNINFSTMKQSAKGSKASRTIYREPIPLYYARCHAAPDGTISLHRREGLSHDGDNGVASDSDDGVSGDGDDPSSPSSHGCGMCFAAIRRRFRRPRERPGSVMSARSDSAVLDSRPGTELTVREDVMGLGSSENHIAYTHPGLLHHLLNHVLPTVVHLIHCTVNSTLLKDGVLIIARILNTYLKFCEKAKGGEVISSSAVPSPASQNIQPPHPHVPRVDPTCSNAHPGQPLSAFVPELTRLLKAVGRRLSHALVSVILTTSAHSPVLTPEIRSPVVHGGDDLSGDSCRATLTPYGQALCGALLCSDLMLRALEDVFMPMFVRNGLLDALHNVNTLLMSMASRGQHCQYHSQHAGNTSSSSSSGSIPSDPPPEPKPQHTCHVKELVKSIVLFSWELTQKICANSTLAVHTSAVATGSTKSTDDVGPVGVRPSELKLLHKDFKICTSVQLLNDLADKFLQGGCGMGSEDEDSTPRHLLLELTDIISSNQITSYELMHVDTNILPVLLDSLTEVKANAEQTGVPPLQIYYPAVLKAAIHALNMCITYRLPPAPAEPPNAHPHHHHHHHSHDPHHPHSSILGGVHHSSTMRGTAIPFSASSIPLQIGHSTACYSAALLNALNDRMSRPLTIKCLPYRTTGTTGPTSSREKESNSLYDVEEQVLTVATYPFVTFGWLERHINLRREERIADITRRLGGDRFAPLTNPSPSSVMGGGVSTSAAAPSSPTTLHSEDRPMIQISGLPSSASQGGYAGTDMSTISPTSSPAATGLPSLGTVQSPPHSVRIPAGSTSSQSSEHTGYAQNAGREADGTRAVSRSPVMHAASAAGVLVVLASAVKREGRRARRATQPSSSSSRHHQSELRGRRGTAPPGFRANPITPPPRVATPPLAAEEDTTSAPPAPSTSRHESGTEASTPPNTRQGLDTAATPVRADSPGGDGMLTPCLSTVHPVTASTTSSSSTSPVFHGAAAAAGPPAPDQTPPPSRDLPSALFGAVQLDSPPPLPHPQAISQNISEASGGFGMMSPLPLVGGGGRGEDEVEWIGHDTELPRPIEFIIDGHTIPTHRMSILDAVMLYSQAAAPLRRLLQQCMMDSNGPVEQEGRRPRSNSAFSVNPSLIKATLNKALAVWSMTVNVYYRRGSPSSKKSSTPEASASESEDESPGVSSTPLKHPSVVAAFSEPSQATLRTVKPVKRLQDMQHDRLDTALQACTILMDMLHEAVSINGEGGKGPSSRDKCSAELRMACHNYRLTSALLHDLKANTLPFAFPSMSTLADHPHDNRRLARYVLWTYPTLFPLSLRIQYFDALTGGCRLAMLRSMVPSAPSAIGSGWILMSRSILGSQWLRPSGQSWGVSTTRKHKAVVQRNHILHCAEVLLQRNATNPLPLDVYFDREQGTGLGPTTEFFTLVARELQQYRLRLWRGEPDALGYVYSPTGLFPTIINPNSTPHVRQRQLQLFTFVGRYLARALREGKVLDIHFNPLFYALLLGEDITANPSESLSMLDPVYEQSLQQLEAIAQADRDMGTGSLGEMGLDFTLPGHEGIELIPDGSTVPLTAENIDTYVKLVRGMHLQKGIEGAIRALHRGFHEVFPLHQLQLFSKDELQDLLTGRGDPSAKIWSDEADMATDIVCDHGYTLDSQPVQHLISVVAEFDAYEQRKFLTFISGSPRMPLGGLVPKITLVKRGNEVDMMVDEAMLDLPLPTVNTCFHYVKLPPYSSRAVLREKLLLAIEDGQNSFDLS